MDSTECNEFTAAIQVLDRATRRLGDLGDEDIVGESYDRQQRATVEEMGCAARELGYEYLPEEEVPPDHFAALVAAIDDAEVREGVDLAHLQCASGICPI